MTRRFSTNILAGMLFSLAYAGIATSQVKHSIQGDVNGGDSRQILPFMAVDVSLDIQNTADEGAITVWADAEFAAATVSRRSDAGWTETYEGPAVYDFEQAEGEARSVVLAPGEVRKIQLAMCCAPLNGGARFGPLFSKVGAYRIQIRYLILVVEDKTRQVRSAGTLNFPPVHVKVTAPATPEDQAALKHLKSMKDPCNMLVERPNQRWFEDNERKAWEKSISEFLDNHGQSTWAPYAHLARAQSIARSDPNQAYQHVREALKWEDFAYRSTAQQMEQKLKPQVVRTQLDEGSDNVSKVTREAIRKFLDKVESAVASNDPEKIRAILATRDPWDRDLDALVKTLRKDFPERYGDLKKEDFGPQITQKEAIEYDVAEYREMVEQKGPFRKATFTIKSIRRNEKKSNVVRVRCQLVIVTEKGEEITEEDSRLSMVKQDGEWRLLAF